jgi:hypothetical protein
VRIREEVVARLVDRHDLDVVAQAEARGQPVVDLPLVLHEGADLGPLHVIVGDARHPDREPIGIRARIRRVEVEIARGEVELPVLAAGIEHVERQVIPAGAELDVVVAVLVRDEP